MANPARSATPTHPLIGDLIQAHRQQWSDAYQQNALSYLNRWTTPGSRRGGSSWSTPPPPISTTSLTIAAPRASPLPRWSRTTSSWPASTAGCTPNRNCPGRNPMARVARPKGAGRVDPARIGYVSDADYHRLISSFDMRLTLDCRNAAICSLMYWSGVRRSEVVRIDLDRVDVDRGRLQVIGKNGEWGTVVILDETVTLLRRYLRRRGPDHHAALFIGTSATTAHDGRLRPDAISSMLERRCKPSSASRCRRISSGGRWPSTPRRGA